jgi:acyl-CoA-dependent ceramide synthase
VELVAISEQKHDANWTCTGNSLNLLILLGLTHFFLPRARRRTHKVFELSYCDTTSGEYGRGLDDMHFIFFWIVVFVGLCAAVMDYILKHLARMGGIESIMDTRHGKFHFKTVHTTGH